jgi:transposase
MENGMSEVVIGMDPRKRSATIEVMAGDETVLGGGRYLTDISGYRAMLTAVRQWPDRRWAIEGCQGIGAHIASRLIAGGERVVDVPPRLSARARVYATGQGRKTDATTRTRSPWSPRGCRGCGRLPAISSWPCCGSWPTGAGHRARTTPG